MAHPRNKYERRILRDNIRARKKSNAKRVREEVMLQAITTEVPEDYYEQRPHISYLIQS